MQSASDVLDILAANGPLALLTRRRNQAIKELKEPSSKSKAHEGEFVNVTDDTLLRDHSQNLHARLSEPSRPKMDLQPLRLHQMQHHHQSLQMYAQRDISGFAHGPIG